MKLGVSNAVLESEGLNESSTFKIEASAKAFSILSDGLYKNKIGSIVRELLCNAYDAHVDAGTLDTPIEIKYPTSWTGEFSIRDFGTGLSHEDIMTLYTTYFKSTKTNSNDFIGCLGLGSKSPFAYTDSFTVESYYEGFKKSYLCFKDDKGPSITKLSEEPTTEHNGLKIILMVKDGDASSFRNELNEFLKYNTINYEMNGSTRTSTVYAAEIDNVFITDEYTYSREILLRQGQVCYNVDTNSSINIRNYSFLYNSNNSIIIDVPIGSVEVVASREGIQYTKQTVEIINKFLSDANEKIKNYYINKMNSYKSNYDKCRFIFNNFKAKNDVKHSFIKINTSIDMDDYKSDYYLNSVRHLMIEEYKTKLYNKYKIDRNDTSLKSDEEHIKTMTLINNELEVYTNKYCYINLKTTKLSDKDNYCILSDKHNVCILNRKSTGNTTKLVDAIISKHGNNNIVFLLCSKEFEDKLKEQHEGIDDYIINVNDIKIERDKQQSRDPNKYKHCFNSSNRICSPTDSVLLELPDDNKAIYYLIREGNNLKTNNTEILLNHFKDKLKEKGVETEYIYYLTDTQVKNISKKRTCVELVDFVKTQYYNEIVKLIRCTKLISSINDAFDEPDFIDTLYKNIETVKPKDIRKIVYLYKKLKYNTSLYMAQSLHDMYCPSNFDDAIKLHNDNIMKFIKQIKNKYMFNLFSAYRCTTHKQEFINIINKIGA